MIKRLSVQDRKVLKIVGCLLVALVLLAFGIIEIWGADDWTDAVWAVICVLMAHYWASEAARKAVALGRWRDEQGLS